MDITAFPMPTNIRFATNDEVHAATREFIHTFAGYALDNHIKAADDNRTPLPDDNDFAIFQVVNRERAGTNVTTYGNTDESTGLGTYTEIETILADVMIACCSDIGGLAFRRASALETAAHAYSGCRFFAQYGIGCDYATAPRQLGIEDEDKQNVERWVVTLTISYNTALSMDIPYIDTLNVKLKNVDVVYPPK